MGPYMTTDWSPFKGCESSKVMLMRREEPGAIQGFAIGSLSQEIESGFAAIMLSRTRVCRAFRADIRP